MRRIVLVSAAVLAAAFLGGCSYWMFATNAGAVALRAIGLSTNAEQTKPDITVITNDRGEIITAWPPPNAD